MHLVSTREQQVRVAGATFAFGTGETIQSESSNKYDLPRPKDLMTAAGFDIGALWAEHRVAERFRQLAVSCTGLTTNVPLGENPT